MLETLKLYRNYYQVEDTFSLIGKMEKISNKKLGTDELKMHLKHRDYGKYNTKIKEIAERVKQNRFIITDAKSELHINPFVGFDEKELEESRKKYLSERFELIQELIKYKKWDKLKTLLRYIEYYDISECSINVSYERDFLTRCEKLMQEMPSSIDSTIREMVSALQEKVKQKRDYLTIKEQSKDLWMEYKNINDFNNPILKKTQELFLQLLYLVGYKKENIDRCKSDIKASAEKVFISADGKIASPRSVVDERTERRHCSPP